MMGVGTKGLPEDLGPSPRKTDPVSAIAESSGEGLRFQGSWEDPVLNMS